MDNLYSVTMANGKTHFDLTEDKVLPLISGENGNKWVSVTPQSSKCEINDRD